ncbi:HNH endonuclease [Senegalia massiliensis]|uniref:HNH endonuclease n=1 Tax=Senegalia massiliensis TaxID=1720316 RepID=UPI00102FBF24|nr:HNH endonuclease [Senegalia massiliensis]
MNKKLLKYIQEGNEIKFYQSIYWRRMREEILKRDNYECQHCKDKGKYSKGECVHHKEHLKDNPMRGLDPSNLITLCNVCHNKEHPEKFFKSKPKKFINEERW